MNEKTDIREIYAILFGSQLEHLAMIFSIYNEGLNRCIPVWLWDGEYCLEDKNLDT